MWPRQRMPRCSWVVARSVAMSVWERSGAEATIGGLDPRGPEGRSSRGTRTAARGRAGHRRLEESVETPPHRVDFGDAHLTYSRRVVEQLRQVGVRVDVIDLNPSEYADRVWRQGDFQAYLGPLPPLNAPNSYLIGLVRSGSAGNKTGYGTPALDELVDAQSGELDPAVRRDIARKAALVLLDEGVRFTPAAQAQAWGWWPRVKGLHVNFANREYHFWSRVWVD